MDAQPYCTTGRLYQFVRMGLIWGGAGVGVGGGSAALLSSVTSWVSHLKFCEWGRVW